jgi:hypothetical protein
VLEVGKKVAAEKAEGLEEGEGKEIRQNGEIIIYIFYFLGKVDLATPPRWQAGNHHPHWMGEMGEDGNLMETKGKSSWQEMAQKIGKEVEGERGILIFDG